MRTAELERDAGLSRHTLRYYEKLGLIHSFRDDNNYRRYPGRTLEDLTLIRQLQEMGFSLEEIRELLAAIREDRIDCNEGARLMAEKIQVVDQKIAALQRARAMLVKEKVRLEISAAGRSE